MYRIVIEDETGQEERRCCTAGAYFLATLEEDGVGTQLNAEEGTREEVLAVLAAVAKIELDELATTLFDAPQLEKVRNLIRQAKEAEAREEESCPGEQH